MVTKWKDIIKRIWKELDNQSKKLMGGFLTVVGVILVRSYTNNYASFDSVEEMLYMGIASVFTAIGVTILGRRLWERKYREWQPNQANFYRAWLKECLRWEIWLVVLTVVLALGVYLRYDSYEGKWWIARNVNFVVAAVYVICQVTLLRLADRKMNELMGNTAEITRKTVEEALEIERKSLEKVSRSDQLRIDLITNVSHDLKTPLTSIVGYLELMKKEELSDTVRDYVNVITERTDKLKEMIGSLFSLAKASSGNVELQMEKFEVNRMLEQILADMKDKIDESGLQFVTQLTEENTELITDNMYFYRICQNLIENALKYSAKGTRVFVKTYTKEDGRLQIDIINTAGYLMDFNKEDILERFARADKARSTDGNGLGLAIVSTYAKALGGEFDIQVDCDQFKAQLIFEKGNSISL